MSKKGKWEPSEADKERYRISDENMNNEKSMVAEMEASGMKVVRCDTFSACGAKLVTPEIIHVKTKKAHDYYPNAVRELYDQWKSEWEEDRADP